MPMGYATPLLVGTRLFVFGRQQDQEVMTALDAGTGATQWRTSYPAPVTLNPRSGSYRHGDGPKSTPAYADGRLFTLGMGGIVSAFDAATGRQLWQHPAPPVLPLYGTATSPIVDGDQVIVHVGGHDRGALTAFDAATGVVRWAWNGDGPAYGSPMLAELDGTRQIIGMSQTSVVGVAAATGTLLWRRPFLPPNTTSSVTPILFERTVLVSGQSMGVTAFAVAKRGDGWSTETLWENPEVSIYMSNGVVAGDTLVAMSHKNSGQYFALDVRSGKTLWTTRGREATNTAIVRAGQMLFLLKDEGQLVIAPVSREGLTPIRSYAVADSPTWAQPVVAGDRVFIRDAQGLAAWLWR